MLSDRKKGSTIQGLIFDNKEFAVHDGPGIRVTVFLKGCPLNCTWCHNPEGQSFFPELMEQPSSCIDCKRCRQHCSHSECSPFGRCLKVCPLGLLKIAGKKVDAHDYAAYLKKHYGSLLTKYKGGITISGGEPLAQPEFLIEFIKELKPLNIAVETCGYGKNGDFQEIIGLADLILFDLKHMDPILHKKYTGVGNKLILSNLSLLMKAKKPFILRIVAIPGVNDTLENMKNAADFIKASKEFIKVELLPYNPYTGAKYPLMGMEYKPEFDENKVPQFHREVFTAKGIGCKVL